MSRGLRSATQPLADDRGASIAEGVAGLSWRYRLYGLQVESALDLRALPQSDWIERRGDQLIINLSPSGRFLVEGGTRITIDDAQAGIAALRWRLLAIAFGALLHQRSVLTLHSTAIAIGGRNIGRVGVSGPGKSTLGAFLHRRGHPVRIDDVCAVAMRQLDNSASDSRHAAAYVPPHTGSIVRCRRFRGAWPPRQRRRPSGCGPSYGRPGPS
jgi:hypothetical protein